VAQPASNPYPNPLATDLNATVKYLLSQAFSKSTSVTYRRASTLHASFCAKTGRNASLYPIGISDAILFIAYLFERNMAPNTISTYIGAMATINKLHGGSDIFNQFLVKKNSCGC